jgi:pseudoazurin
MRQWWQRRSLRLRLTVWYAIASTIVLLALSGLLFFLVRGRLLSQLDRQLRDDFEMIESSVVRDQAGNLRWLAYGRDNDEVEWEKEAGPWFEILSPTGSILLREGLSSDWKPLLSLIPPLGTTTSFSAELRDHLHVRALADDTVIAGEPVLLRVFRSEAELRRAMAEFGAVLGFGLPLGMALSAVGGYLIAHRSLSPVSQIAAHARQITADLLGGRLPVPNPHDELGQLAAVFNATLARPENSFAELRRFTADASHELRTPLTALRAVGEAALRSDAVDTKNLREALSSMLEEVRRLSDLVDALLLLARADTGGVSPSLRQVDLAGLLHEVRDTLQVLAEEKNQQIELAAEQLSVRADRELLRLALLNLVHNASRYSPAGSMISLRVRQRDANALVEVVDQGPGIAAEHQKKIFDPRNAPTNLNSALNIIHWRGDRENLEDQVIKALTSPITSGQPDLKAVEDRVSSIPGYTAPFKAAFADSPNPVTAQNIAKAIGAYERTLVTPSRFDSYLNGKSDALSASARSGLNKFINTGCVMCHSGVGVGGGMYQKFGVLEDYWVATGSTNIDKGRIDVTKDPTDLYVFRVPSLRNVAKTAPYFHDGSVPTLPEAVKVMARVQLGVALSEADTSDIVAFLETLTGDLPADFVTVPTLLQDRSSRNRNQMLKTISSIALATTCFVAFPVGAEEFQVKELNRCPTGFFVFDPELVRIKPGDTVTFIASDKGHDVHSVSGMIPDGAQPIDGKTNQDTKVTFNQPGVYAITCKVHTLMGMMCVVVVGDPANTDKIDPSALPPKAKAKTLSLLNQIKNG